LSSPLYISAGTFFIGFHQNTNTTLNVGVDRNTNASNKIYYNATGIWSTSPYAGSLMMHPVFGSTADFVGVTENTISENSYTVYPNPARDILCIRSGGTIAHKTFYSITDIYGRMVIENQPSTDDKIDVSTLTNGVYFLKIVSDSSVSINKFIISK